MVAVGLVIFFSVSIFKILKKNKAELHFYEHDPSKSEKVLLRIV